MLLFLKRAAPWFLAASLFASGWHIGACSKDAEWKEVIQNEYVQRVEATRSTQAAVDKISAKYQEDLAALEGSTDRIIDDLRSDNKRLRIRVKTTRSAQGQCRCESDGRAELDERDAKRILGITQKGDAWIKALQDTIRELQKERNESGK